MIQMHSKISFGDREIEIESDKFENGGIVVIYEKKRQLGTIAFAVPSPTGGEAIITQIFGSINELTSRALAEHLAQKNRQLTIVSVFLSSRDDDPALLRILLEGIRKIQD